MLSPLGGVAASISINWPKPRMALSGVRNSWLMRERNSLLALFARSASSLAARRAVFRLLARGDVDAQAGRRLCAWRIREPPLGIPWLSIQRRRAVAGMTHPVLDGKSPASPAGSGPAPCERRRRGPPARRSRLERFQRVRAGCVGGPAVLRRLTVLQVNSAGAEIDLPCVHASGGQGQPQAHARSRATRLFHAGSRVVLRRGVFVGCSAHFAAGPAWARTPCRRTPRRRRSPSRPGKIPRCRRESARPSTSRRRMRTGKTERAFEGIGGHRVACEKGKPVPAPQGKGDFTARGHPGQPARLGEADKFVRMVEKVAGKRFPAAWRPRSARGARPTKAVRSLPGRRCGREVVSRFMEAWGHDQ